MSKRGKRSSSKRLRRRPNQAKWRQIVRSCTACEAGLKELKFVEDGKIECTACGAIITYTPLHVD
ncbi:MAG: hypothetical protein ABIG66_00190 [Candidatus Kerfeldbacteria bacterium]